MSLLWFKLIALASLSFWKQFLFKINLFGLSERSIWENIVITGNLIAFILYLSTDFFPVLDILGCDRDCRMNDNFVSIMLEAVRCSKFIKIFSYLRSSTDMPYASRICFSGSWEPFLFFAIPVLLNMSCYIATRCVWGESSHVWIVWVRLWRIKFKQLSKRTCSCSCLLWLSCGEVTLSFCCCCKDSLFLAVLHLDELPKLRQQELL